MKKWLRITMTFFLIPWSGFGFTFTVTPTAETCTGNGALSFVASNTIPGGSIVYEIYKLPNVSV